MNSTQEQPAIKWKDMTLDQRMARLNVLRDQAQDRLDQYLELEQEASERLQAVSATERALAERERRLGQREKELEVIADPGRGVQSVRERAKVLLEEISKSGGKEDRDRNAHWTRVEAERLAAILKQAKSAGTVLGKVAGAFKDVLGKREAETIAAARSVLGHLAQAAEIAKEQGRRLAEERKRHEEAVAKAASEAMHATFADAFATPSGQVLFCSAAYSHSCAFRELTSGEAFKRTFTTYDYSQNKNIEHPCRPAVLKETLDDALIEAKSRLASKIRDEINNGVDATAAAQAMRAKFDGGLPELQSKYGDLAQRVTTELVARQMEKLNT